MQIGDFPGSPVVKTSFPPTQEGVVLIPGQGSEDPICLTSKKPHLKEKQHCNKFNKTLKNRSTSKKIFFMADTHCCKVETNTTL